LLEPLFTTLPVSRAMPRLVVDGPGSSGHADEVDSLLESSSFGEALICGLWLYVDELDRSHRISQGLEDATGSFWHGIMHRREGDFPNSHHWFRKVGAHSAMKDIEGYDPHAFIDEVEAAHLRGEAPEHLADLQRREWAALFAWCARVA